MAESAPSSISLQRSTLSSINTINVTPSYKEREEDLESFSNLPYLVTPLYAPHQQLLRFMPGAFRYQGKLIGHGASFVVEKHSIQGLCGLLDDPFLAHSLTSSSMGGVFAVKRIRKQAVIPWKTFQEIETELFVFNIIQNPKNIVPFLGLGWEIAPIAGLSRLWPILIFAYARHGNLASYQKDNPDLSYESKKKLLLDVAAGLDELRAEKLSHGDLKSENVLIFGKHPDGITAKLSDFGYSPVDFRGGAVLGATGVWSAPEKPKLGDYSSFFARDTYSWGLLVLRVMLGGRNPFDLVDARGYYDLGSIYDIKTKPSAELDRWLKECLVSHYSPADVHQNVDVLSKVLLQCLNSNPRDRDLDRARKLWGIVDLEPHLPKLHLKSMLGKFDPTSFARLPPRVRLQFEHILLPMLAARDEIPMMPVDIAVEQAIKSDWPQALSEEALADLPPSPRNSARQTRARNLPSTLPSHIRAFFEACSSGDHYVLKNMLSTNKIQVNHYDSSDGETGLVKACRLGQYTATLCLLDHGADPGLFDSYHGAPMHWLWAFREPQLSIVAKRLVEAGAPFGTISVADWKETKWEILGPDSSGTPLHHAVGGNHLDAAESLLDLGADPSLPSSFVPHHTPVTLACSLHLGRTEPRGEAASSGSERSMLSILLSNTKNYKPNELHGITNLRRLPSFMLNSYSAQRELIHGASEIEEAARKTLDLLISKGEKVSDPLAGYSLLHLAVIVGDQIMVKVVLESYQKRDVNLTFQHGQIFWQPPLLYAIRHGRRDIFKLLLTAGANPLQRFGTDYIGSSNGSGSRREPWYSEYDRRLNQCGNLNRLRGPRCTYLHTCAGTGHGLFFAWHLIKLGVDVNSYDSNWESPLFLAVLACDFVLSEFLLQRGDASIRYLSDDRTILGHLVDGGFGVPYESIQYLLETQKREGFHRPVNYLAVHGRYWTFLHMLVEDQTQFRNSNWAEALLDLFAGYLPDKRLLDVQCDGTADTALMLAVKSGNALLARRLLDWGADPSVPNYEDGSPMDYILSSAHKILLEHDIDYSSFINKKNHTPQLRPQMKKLEDLEEMHVILKRYNGKNLRPLPPHPDSYTHFQQIDDELRKRHKDLGIDLESVQRTFTFVDGPIKEICDAIVTELLNGPTEPIKITQSKLEACIAKQLLQAPEAACSSRRLYRVKQHIATIAGRHGYSLHLDFDPEQLRWRIHAAPVASGLLTGGYILAPRIDNDLSVSSWPLPDEHSFQPAGRCYFSQELWDVVSADLDNPSNATHQIGEVRLSYDIPHQPDEPVRMQTAMRKNEDNAEGFHSSLGPVGILRLEQLKPKPGQGFTVCRDDELGQLWYADQPLPAGHYVLIQALSSGAIFSLLTAVDGKDRYGRPVKSSFQQSREKSTAQETKECSDSSTWRKRFTSSSSKARNPSTASESSDLSPPRAQTIETVASSSSPLTVSGASIPQRSSPREFLRRRTAKETSDTMSTSPNLVMQRTPERSTSDPTAGLGLDPELVQLLRSVPIVITTNASGSNNRPEASVVSSFINQMTASGRARVIGVPQGETNYEAVRAAIEREMEEKDQIKKTGVLKGKH